MEQETCDVCDALSRSAERLRAPMSYFLELDTRVDWHGELCDRCAEQFYDWLQAQRAAHARSALVAPPVPIPPPPRDPSAEMAWLAHALVSGVMEALNKFCVVDFAGRSVVVTRERLEKLEAATAAILQDHDVVIMPAPGTT